MASALRPRLHCCPPSRKRPSASCLRRPYPRHPAGPPRAARPAGSRGPARRVPNACGLAGPRAPLFGRLPCSGHPALRRGCAPRHSAASMPCRRLFGRGVHAAPAASAAFRSTCGNAHAAHALQPANHSAATFIPWHRAVASPPAARPGIHAHAAAASCRRGQRHPSAKTPPIIHSADAARRRLPGCAIRRDRPSMFGVRCWKFDVPRRLDGRHRQTRRRDHRPAVPRSASTRRRPNAPSAAVRREPLRFGPQGNPNWRTACGRVPEAPRRTASEGNSPSTVHPADRPSGCAVGTRRCGGTAGEGEGERVGRHKPSLWPREGRQTPVERRPLPPSPRQPLGDAPCRPILPATPSAASSCQMRIRPLAAIVTPYDQPRPTFPGRLARTARQRLPDTSIATMIALCRPSAVTPRDARPAPNGPPRTPHPPEAPPCVDPALCWP
jgi:hypothetical protein